MFPHSLPPRLELVVMLIGVAAGYNLAMRILPREKIDLARFATDEQIAAPVVMRASEQSVSMQPKAEVSTGGVCTVPPSGGPALNERFEPC
tara:strand:- start:76 stop:348 length:273 start_codon:yes stop_codon:yes gene_type:complete